LTRTSTPPPPIKRAFPDSHLWSPSLLCKTPTYRKPFLLPNILAHLVKRNIQQNPSGLKAEKLEEYQKMQFQRVLDSLIGKP